MKDAYYFSHDYHARADENIIRLLKTEKESGYGLYWMIIEMLYENGGSIQKDYETIAYELRTQCERIKSVCECFDLFYFKDDRIFSKSVDRRLAERENRSFSARNSAMKRWGDNAKAMPTHCEGNAIKERKGKERKGKERDKSVCFAQPTQIEVEQYCKERGNGIKAQKFIDFYQSKGWLIGKNKMKDWKAAIRTWEQKDQDLKPIEKKNYGLHDDWARALKNKQENPL